MKNQKPIYYAFAKYSPAVTFLVQGNKVPNADNKGFSVVGPFMMVSWRGKRLPKEELIIHDGGLFISKSYTFKKAKRTSFSE